MRTGYRLLIAGAALIYVITSIVSSEKGYGMPPRDDREPISRTPGIVFTALTFALLGFACGVPALIGLVLGIIARPQAKAAGTGVGLATAAIAISVAWILFFALLIVMAMRSQAP